MVSTQTIDKVKKHDAHRPGMNDQAAAEELGLTKDAVHEARQEIRNLQTRKPK